MEIATFIAIIVGPGLAVLATRYLDDRRFQKARKLDIFRTLMKTRGLPFHWDHVGALNLVEVEFIDHPKVIETRKAYLTHLGEPIPDITQKAQQDALIKNRTVLLTKLIDAIAEALNIKIEQLDILQANYVPPVWEDDRWNDVLVRRGLINVLYGHAAIKINPGQPQQNNDPYPPQPTPRDGDPTGTLESIS